MTCSVPRVPSTAGTSPDQRRCSRPARRGAVHQGDSLSAVPGPCPCIAQRHSAPAWLDRCRARGPCGPGTLVTRPDPARPAAPSSLRPFPPRLPVPLLSGPAACDVPAPSAGEGIRGSAWVPRRRIPGWATRSGRCVRGGTGRPARSGADLGHLKCLVPPSVVRYDFAYSQPQPGRIHRPGCTVRARYEPLDPAGQVPACPVLAELQQLWPDRFCRSAHGKGPVHDDIGRATTASPGRGDFFSALLASTLLNIVIYWPSGDSSNMFGSNP
jgi:hypothetical protein